MSHEVIQQVKLVKYNIKTYEKIQIKHNNGKEENGIRTNTHMKWCGFGTESSSDLHCMYWHGSLDHPMGRSSNRLCIESTMSTSPDRVRIFCSWVRISPNGSETLNTQANIQININTRYTDTYTQTHTCTPTHIHIQVYTHIYTICMHASYNTLTRTVMQTHPSTHPLIKTHLLITKLYTHHQKTLTWIKTHTHALIYA